MSYSPNEYFSVKKLRENRFVAIQEMQALAKARTAENRDTFTSDEESKLDKLEAEVKGLDEKIRTEERVERIKSHTQEKADVAVSENRIARRVTKTDKRQAEKAWALAAHGQRLSPEYQACADRMNVQLGSRTVTVPMETRDSTGASTTLTLGGYSFSQNVFGGLVEFLKYFSNLRSKATILTTQNAQTITLDISDQTSRKAALVTGGGGLNSGENVAIDNANLTQTYATLSFYDFATAIYPVSLSILQDAAFDFGDYIERHLGESMARGIETYFVTGSGSSQPGGIVTGAGSGATASTSSAITFTDLMTLYHAVDYSYRQKGSWGMNDNTLMHLRLITDGIGRPLIFTSLDVAQPDRLLGHEIVLLPDMASVGATGSGNKSMIWGDFSFHYIRELTDVQVLSHPSLTSLSLNFLAWGRWDSVLTNSNAVKYLVH